MGVTQTDGRGNTTTYAYNARNKLIRKVDPNGAGSPAKTESYTYDLYGNMLNKLDRNGITTSCAYDIHGRMLSEQAGNETISYTYDHNGNQLTTSDSTGVTARSYDELNRVRTKSLSTLGTSVFYYDIIDAQMGVEDGEYAEKTVDPRGNVTVKVYDRAGMLVRVKDSEAAGSTVYDYDCAGRKTSVNYPGGARETYTYLDNNLLDTLKNYSTGGAIPDDSYSYTYDAAGNQLSKSEIVGSVNKGITQFAYDELNRLSRVTEPNGKQTAYTYDGAGNRLTETVTENETAKLISYSYNEQNRLTQSESDKNNTKETTVYKYDNNGNLLYKSMEITKKIDPYNPPTTHFGMFIPGQGKTEYAPQEVIDSVGYYSYDAFNRLIKETSGNGTIESRYNGEGLRVQTTSNGVVKRYVYESDKVVLEVDDRGRQTARNVYGSSLISRRMGVQQAYYFYNGHGDVTRLIDSGGIELASYYYDAWGTVLGEDEDEGIDNPYRYAGYVYDKETKLYYLNARYYDPQTARFLSEDTYSGDPNDPLSLNMYTYVSNNPVIYNDPTGHTGVTININGKTIQGVNTTGKTEVGLRDISEAMGGQVNWDGKHTATVSINGKTLSYDTTGTNKVMVNLRDFVDYVSPGEKNISYKSNKNGTATVNISEKNNFEKVISLIVDYQTPALPVRINFSMSNSSSSAGSGKTTEVPQNTPSAGPGQTKDSNELQKKIDNFVDIAKSQVGKGEGDKDKASYVSTTSPWCAGFVKWVANQAEIKMINSDWVWDYVKYYGNSGKSGESQYTKQSNNYYPLTSGYKPCAGDLIIFRTPGKGHIGIVVAYDEKNNRVYTVEGNSGNRVQGHYYSMDNSYVTGFCKVGGTRIGTPVPGSTPGMGESKR